MVSLIPPSVRAHFRQAQAQKQRAHRLAQQQDLVKDQLPIACSTPELQADRTRQQKDMATWSLADWERYDTPWARLLTQWLDDADLTTPEDQAGLRDLRTKHQQAWWNARHIKTRPEQTPVTRLVWERLEAGSKLPAEALQMASMSSPEWTFSSALWSWALRQPTLDGMDMALSIHYGTSPHPKSILEALPTAQPGYLEALWKKAYGSRRALLRGWIEEATPAQADPFLHRLAVLPQVIHTNGSGQPIADAWHEGFFQTLEAGLRTPHKRYPNHEGAPQALAQWAKHWPGTHPRLFQQEWRTLWNKVAQDHSEATLLPNLDALTQSMESIIPLDWWTKDDPEAQWDSERLRRMPLTKARVEARERQEKAHQEPPSTPRRIRRRS